jgi:L-ascorbate metabolism protein UlaG (beta-lactamase superfamily)
MKRMIIFLCLMTTVYGANFSRQSKTEGLEITWIGHSCFEIEYSDLRILIDPFTPEWFDYVRPQGKYNYVFSSHKAEDHRYFDGIHADFYLLASGDQDTFFQKSRSGNQLLKGKTLNNTETGTFTFWTVPSFHDDQNGAVDGVNGILCFDFDGIKVVHLGDLGHVLEEKHIRKIGTVDILMIPIDGYFTINIDMAKKIINQLEPKVAFPMHYKTEKSKLTHPIYTEKDILDGFTNIKKLHRSRLVIDENILNQQQQIILLKYAEK